MDSDYDGATVDEVKVTITDNDTAGVTVEPTALDVAEGGSGSYAVVLDTEPAADVVVSVAGASGTDLSLSGTELTYTTSNWSTEQTVTVTAGEDDDTAADTVTLTHTAASMDSDYDGATVDEVKVTITDNDTAGVTVEPTALTVAEGGSGSYAVVLDTEPAADVVVSVAGASGTDLSLSATELTYTTSNWSTEQTVTVTAGEDDDTADDTVKLTHTAASMDGDYDGATVDEVKVTITDNDAAGVTVAPTDLDVAEGGSGSYAVVLNTEPAADVVVSVAGASGTDLSVSATELTYTTSNWSTEQTVTVTAGEDDDTADDTVKLTHTAASTDSDYDGATVDEVTVTITDNDTAGVTVAPTAVDVAEGGSGSYAVVLDTEPAADVVVSAAGASGTDLSLSATELTYTTSNWSTEQTVTVTAGEDDDTAADTVTLTHTAASMDSDYEGATVDEVTVTITDNDALRSQGPVRVTAVSGGPSSIELSWTAPSGAGGEAVTGYRIQVSADEGVTWTELMHDTGTTTSHVHRGLPRGAQRYYRVAALRTNEVGPYGAPDYARTTPAAPGKPKLTARLDAERYLRLVWNDVTDGTDGTGRIAVNYDAAWSDTSARGPWHSLDPPAAGGSGERPCIGVAAPPHCPRDAATEAGSGGLTALRQSLSHDGSRYRIAVGGAVAGTRYYFRVRGRNYAAHGEWSDVASLVAVRDGPQPEVQGPTRPRGPSSALMEVSIAAAAAPVTEGGDAVFTLTRSGATAAALTVAVSVTEAGSVLSGTAPTAVTFPAQASEVQLSVATLDDEAAEADARVTAAVVSGAGYRVAAGAGTAGIDVLDNDRTASSVIVLWSADIAVVDYGTGGIGAGSADLFSNVGGSGGLQARWLWYYAPERTLYLAFAQSLPESAELTLHVGDVVLAFPGGDASFSWDDIDVDWTDGQTVAVRLTLEDDEDESTTGPGVSVADAQVREAAGASLVFRVTLEVAQTTAVSVRYATADGTATAGADYRSVSGAVRFEPGETEQTVEVAVLNDAHDEDAETLTLTLSEPFAARLTDAEATGTIENADPLPQAWLARFGRTAAEQVLGAVDRRLRASRSAETQVTLAGHRIPHAPPAADPAAIDAAAERQVAAWLRGEPEASTARHLTARELLSESAFQAGVPTADGGNLTLWGGGAFTRFGGRDGAVELDGDVSAALLGADYASGGWLAGLALAYHESIGGSYRSPAAGGELHSWLVGGYPYVGYAAERLALWGAAGYGQGRLTMTAPGDEPLETGIRLLLGAGGARGELLAPASAGGAGLAVNLDALVLRTSSEATPGLAAAEADVSRLRLAVEGSYALSLGGSRLTPTAELGVRHDGGDAETGFGLDLSGGLSWRAPALGLAAQVSGHGLLAHEAEGFHDWGVAGLLSYDPTPASDLGLSLSVSPAWGGQATSAAAALWARPTMAGLTAEAPRAEPAGRIAAEAAYGLPLFGGDATGTPYLGLRLADSDREYRLGYRIRAAGGDFSLSLEGTRHEEPAGTAPRHTLTLQGIHRW